MGGKLELDGLLSEEEFARARERATRLATSEPRLSDADLQKRFAEELNSFQISHRTTAVVTERKMCCLWCSGAWKEEPQSRPTGLRVESQVDSTGLSVETHKTERGKPTGLRVEDSKKK